MESQLTSLAKTVAQISVEIKSIKSIEDTLFNLRNDLQNLKNFTDSSNRLYEKHNSDPNLFNKSILNQEAADNNTELTNANYNINTKHYNTVLKAYESRSEYSGNQNQQNQNNRLTRRQEFTNEREKYKTWVPSYSNPKKLKKLTK